MIFLSAKKTNTQRVSTSKKVRGRQEEGIAGASIRRSFPSVLGDTEKSIDCTRVRGIMYYTFLLELQKKALVL